MYQNVIIVLIALSPLLQVSETIVCTPDTCAAVSCTVVENCEGPNKVIKPGGFCNCCNTCYTILGENETCPILSSSIRGAPPPSLECGEGLVCYDGRCRSFKDLATKAVVE